MVHINAKRQSLPAWIEQTVRWHRRRAGTDQALSLSAGHRPHPWEYACSSTCPRNPTSGTQLAPLAAERRPGLVLEVDVSELLAVVIAQSRRPIPRSTRRREAARRSTQPDEIDHNPA
jgi:hypothetical protein